MFDSNRRAIPIPLEKIFAPAKIHELLSVFVYEYTQTDPIIGWGAIGGALICARVCVCIHLVGMRALIWLRRRVIECIHVQNIHTVGESLELRSRLSLVCVICVFVQTYMSYAVARLFCCWGRSRLYYTEHNQPPFPSFANRQHNSHTYIMFRKVLCEKCSGVSRAYVDAYECWPCVSGPDCVVAINTESDTYLRTYWNSIAAHSTSTARLQRIGASAWSCSQVLSRARYNLDKFELCICLN